MAGGEVGGEKEGEGGGQSTKYTLFLTVEALFKGA